MRPFFARTDMVAVTFEKGKERRRKKRFQSGRKSTVYLSVSQERTRIFWDRSEIGC